MALSEVSYEVGANINAETPDFNEQWTFNGTGSKTYTFTKKPKLVIVNSVIKTSTGALNSDLIHGDYSGGTLWRMIYNTDGTITVNNAFDMGAAWSNSSIANFPSETSITIASSSTLARGFRILAWY